MADVTITVDGKKVIQPPGTLLIEACKIIGIEIPSLTQLATLDGAGGAEEQPITSSKNDLFSSSTLGRYCSALTDVMESHLLLLYEGDSADRELFVESREWNDPGSVR